MELNAFKRFAIERCGLTLENPVVVGVSGGADSLCLAECFIKTGFNIIIAHFDHQLRQNSKVDAEHVVSYAKSRGIPCLIGREDIRQFCKENNLSIEEGARQARYDFLFNQARKTGAQAVATGHTANDQAETVLMHFIRGSGVSGLKGMKPRTILAQFDEYIPVVRPLIQVSRLETEKFCDEHQVGYINDESNTDTAYFRNRIRLELLPLLESYQPGFLERLQRTSQVMEEVDELFSRLTDAALQRVTISAGPIYHEFSLKALQAEDIAIQRVLFRRAIHELRQKNRDIDFDSTHRIISLIQTGDSGKRVEILDGLEAVLSRGKLTIKDRSTEIIASEQLWMPPGESIILDINSQGVSVGNLKIHISVNEPTGKPVSRTDYRVPLKAVIDLDTLRLPLMIRTRQNGDRIIPYGMDGHSMKLSDYWINAGLPKAARESWPLVCDQVGIFWIPGFRVMHPNRVTESTKRIITFSVTRY
jgi:tRNA(Ile)-lysidine synthase